MIHDVGNSVPILFVDFEYLLSLLIGTFHSGYLINLLSKKQMY